MTGPDGVAKSTVAPVAAALLPVSDAVTVNWVFPLAASNATLATTTSVPVWFAGVLGAIGLLLLWLFDPHPARTGSRRPNAALCVRRFHVLERCMTSLLCSSMLGGSAWADGLATRQAHPVCRSESRTLGGASRSAT